MFTHSPVVKCPRCDVPMGVRLVSSGAAGKTTKVIYACVICGEETARLYKMPESPARLRGGVKRKRPSW